MELTISKKNFLRGLARTHSVADRKSSMPALSNILLTAEANGKLRLAATDLYLGVSAQVDAKVKRKGSLAVGARILFDIVKNLPEGEVQLAADEKKGIEIRCGKVRYRVPGYPGEDFPPLPNPEGAPFFTVDAETLGELITLTSYSMSSDDTRPHLAGALLEGEGTALRMVTTDGHRLSKAEINVADKSAAYSFSMLVPNKGISELKKQIEDARTDRPSEGPLTIEVAKAGTNAFFRREGIQLSVKLADEQFPPYGKVIPQSQTRRAVVQRTGFAEALRRISLVVADRSGGVVRIQIEPGMLKITSENPDVGEGSEELEVDYAGEAITIGFNPRYLIDVLSALTEDLVAIELSGELDPGVLRPVGESRSFVGVIMPMRI